MKPSLLRSLSLILIIAAGLVGCASSSGNGVPPTSTPAVAPTTAPTTAPTNEPTTAAYTDPFAYCAAAGTIDKPDASYTGPKVPQSIIDGLKKALNSPADTPNDFFLNGTFWRCMNGQVYACTIGANLPCDSKANTDQTPTQAEQDYCQQNPNSDFIPAVVTGHETIYNWKCDNTTPVAGQPVIQVDAQGYQTNIWYELSPQSK
jgi:hypothetical protein